MLIIIAMIVKGTLEKQNIVRKKKFFMNFHLPCTNDFDPYTQQCT